MEVRSRMGPTSRREEEEEEEECGGGGALMTSPGTLRPSSIH